MAQPTYVYIVHCTLYTIYIVYSVNCSVQYTQQTLRERESKIARTPEIVIVTKKKIGLLRRFLGKLASFASLNGALLVELAVKRCTARLRAILQLLPRRVVSLVVDCNKNDPTVIIIPR